MRVITILSIVLFSLSCTQKNKNKLTHIQELNTKKLTFHSTQNFDDIQLADGLTYEVLFQSGDSILAPDGIVVPSKENLDCAVLIPNKNDSTKAKLFVSFETRVYDKHLGSGGGGFIADVVYESETWQIIGMPIGVDYNPVGQTINNCGGKKTPYGTILSAEEYYTDDKEELYGILKDTSYFNGKPINENFGWMVEIDPETNKATQKLTSFGRYSHEDAVSLSDGKTVYISNDESPAVLFKFVADKPFDYTKGNLYAYSETKKWIELPNDYSSLLNIRNVAIKKGATLFTRHEWMTQIGGKLYIAETGKDSISYQLFVDQGGVLPSYYNNTLIQDPYGRILSLDLETDSIDIVLEGGKQGSMFLTNPDCITSYTYKGNDYLVINEDINGIDKGRSVEEFALNDVFRYNLKTKELEQILTSPRGAETTGGIFDAYGNYFLNIQHPDINNKPPFNRSSLVLIKGIVK